MKRIVIIDDSPAILAAATAVLEGAGFEVIAVDDPGRLDRSAANKPDLVLVDIEMPECFGDDVVSFLKAEWTDDVPIHLYSQLPEEDLAERAGECGADGFIYKGWGVDAMLARVKALLGD